MALDVETLIPTIFDLELYTFLLRHGHGTLPYLRNFFIF